MRKQTGSGGFCSTLAASLLALVLGGCDLVPSFGPPEESVSGSIRMGANLPTEAWRTRTLFIILEREGGGPPLAVQRLVEPRFPYRYVLTKDDAMIRGQAFAGRVRVRARLDADGVAGPLVRGDFEGRSAAPVAVGSENVDVLIDQIGTAPPPVAKKISPPPQQAPSPEEAGAPPAGGPTIGGVVRLAPALAEKARGKAALFIIAHKTRPGPPLAVMRIPNPRFPFAFTMGARDVMLEGTEFSGEVSLSAKLDGDGRVGTQPGDLSGAVPGKVRVGARGVEIVLSQEAGGAPAPRSAPPVQAPGTGERISGVIEVAPALRAQAGGKPVLFLIARKEGAAPRLRSFASRAPAFRLLLKFRGKTS